MKTLAVLLPALLLTAAAAPQTPQAPPAPTPYIETLEVTIHNVDVVVTDKSGKAVTGLRQEDFELLEDGKRKPITNFSAFREEPAAQSPASTRPTSDRVVIAPEAARKVIFYVDEMALTEDSKKKLREQLDAMVVRTMRPGDEALVVRPTQEERLGTGFTQDREAVRSWLQAAIEYQDWRSAPVQLEKIELENDMKSGGPASMRRVTARRWADRVRRRVKQRLGNLKAAVAAATAIQGRKVLVVVTDSLPIEPGREAFRAYKDTLEYMANDTTGLPMKGEGGGDGSGGQAASIWEEHTANPDLQQDWFDYAPLVKEIAHNAAAAGITIYAVQPEIHLGAAAPGGGIDASAPPLRTQPGINVAPPQGNSAIALSDAVSNTETTLRILTDLTGGRWFRGGGRIDEAAALIEADVESYYSLGYRAGEGTDVAHRVEVRVKGRKDVTVRTRKEVVRKSPERAMTDSVVAALIDPTTPNEVPIRLEVEMGAPTADGLARNVNVHAIIPMSALTFLPEGGTQRARYTIHYAAMGKSAEFMSGMQPPQVIDVPAADFEDAKTKYWRYIIPLTIRKGKHDLVIGVLDSVSRQSGIRRERITVE